MNQFDRKLAKTHAKGEELERRIRARHGDVIVFLLGPGYPPANLNRRRRLRDRLKNSGINAIVMEDVRTQPGESLTDKFRRILRDLEPTLYLAIFTERGKPLGLTFELGLLTGILGFEELKSKLRYCVEMMVNEKLVMTQYVREQLIIGRVKRFKGDDELLDVATACVDVHIIDEGWV